MTEFVTIIKKYGVTGVLAMWLWHTDSRLSKVEQELYDCYKAKTANIEKSYLSIQSQYAILVDRPKVKKSRKEA